MTHIIKGGNTPVPVLPLRVAVCRRQLLGAPAVDASVLLLGADGKVRGDHDLVFYNQPSHPSGAVSHLGATEENGQVMEWLELDLPLVEPDVQRLLIAGSCDGGVFGSVQGLSIRALAPDGATAAQYTITDASTETALVLGEFYRRNSGWKFRAVGQGYASGLGGLAADFGIEVEQSAPPQPVPSQPVLSQPVPPRVASPRTPPAQDARPVSFGPEFPAVVRRGRGGDVLTVDAPISRGPVIVEAWYQGDSYFALHTLDMRNREDELLFNTTAPDFRGRALVHHPGNRPLRLHVEADDDWTVAIQPVSAARHLSDGIQGDGPEVLVYQGAAADVDVTYFGDSQADGCFALWCVEPARGSGPDTGDLLINEIGALRQTVPIPDGPLLLRIEADGPWSCGVRPLPVLDRAAAQASGVYSGRGTCSVTLTNPTPGQPALLEYAIESDSPFGYTVRLVDEYGGGEQFLRGGVGGQHGRTLLFRNGESEATLGIEDAVDWGLTLLPVERVAVLTGPVEGTGSDVFRYDGPALLGLHRRTGDGDPLAAHTARAHDRAVISADAGGGRQPVVGPLRAAGTGHSYVLISATDHTGWHIEPEGLDTVPVLGWTVSGHGYGVVRHAGPEADVMLTHEPRDGLDLLVIWALDERLEPVRRVSVGSGLHRLPSGLLQIRTAGRWTLARG